MGCEGIHQPAVPQSTRNEKTKSGDSRQGAKTPSLGQSISGDDLGAFALWRDNGFPFVERKVILELKSVERASAAHRKQIQTYLRLGGCKLGFLLNFGESLMKDGIIRAVNGLPDD